MEIRPYTSSDKTAWDAYVLSHSEGYAYHQCAWREAVARAYGFADLSLLAEEAGSLCGVLPLIDFKLPLLGRSLVSLPYCDVGGVLADNEEITMALQDHVVRLAQTLGARGIELRNGRSSSPATLPASAKVRMLLDLPENSEALLASLKAKLRSQVKKPQRDGLTATLGGREFAEDFYRVFCENMRDLGSPVHSLDWIKAILEAYGERARVGLVLLPDGEAAAAGIILLHGDKASIPWASSLRRFNAMNPNMLLYWTFLSFSADQGFRQFDFGRSTPGEGTYRFKEQWGATAIPLDWCRYETSGRLKPVVAADNKKSMNREMVEYLWRRMPLGLCNVLGPVVRRGVSL